jgi:hypothetical protein
MRRIVKITVDGVTKVVDLLRAPAPGYGAGGYGTSGYGA